MIFFTDSSGKIIEKIGETVYQGSAESQKINLFAPLDASLSVTVAFQLPNGVAVAENVMTPVPIYSNQINGKDLSVFSAWEYPIPKEVTEQYGTVTAQFFFYSSGATPVPQIIASSSTTFQIGRGAQPVLPDVPTPTIYENILALIAALSGQITVGDFAARSLKAWKSDIQYNEKEIVYYEVNKYGAFVVSTKTAFNQAPYDAMGVLNSAYWRELLNLNTIIAEANDAAMNAEEAAGRSEDSAVRAEAAAQRAENVDAEISNAVERAETAAANAKASETIAMNSAESAQIDASDAANSVMQSDNNAKKAETEALKAKAEADRAKNIADSISGGGFIPKGSVPFSELPTDLTEDKKGWLYNLSEGGVTFGDLFVEGNGFKVDKGANVLVTQQVSQSGETVYLYDILGSFVDLSAYAEKKYVDDTFVKISTQQEIVHGTDRFGNETQIQYNETAYGGGLPIRTGGGQIFVNAATEEGHAVNLKQMTDAIAAGGGGGGGKGSSIYDVAENLTEDVKKVLEDYVTKPAGFVLKVGDMLIGENGGRSIITALADPDRYLTVVFLGETHAKADIVRFDEPVSATMGDISQKDLDLLQSNELNLIEFNHELYRLNDQQHDAGFFVYTHVGHDSTNNFFIKCITITVSTLTWVLTTTPVGNVKPVKKTSEMTEPVGVDENGKLFTKVGGGGGGTQFEYLEFPSITQEEVGTVTDEMAATLSKVPNISVKMRNLYYSYAGKDDLGSGGLKEYLFFSQSQTMSSTLNPSVNNFIRSITVSLSDKQYWYSIKFIGNPLRVNGVADNVNVVFASDPQAQIDGARDQANYAAEQADNAVAAIPNKQDKTDNSLETTSKTVVGAINEINKKPTGTVVKVAGATQPEITFTSDPQAQMGANTLAINNIKDSQLPLKQDKTDETLQTKDKTIVGAINELNAGGGGGGKGGAPITRVTALPAASQAEFEKNLIYGNDTTLNYLQKKMVDTPTYSSIGNLPVASTCFTYDDNGTIKVVLTDDGYKIYSFDTETNQLTDTGDVFDSIGISYNSQIAQIKNKIYYWNSGASFSEKNLNVYDIETKKKSFVKSFSFIPYNMCSDNEKYLYFSEEGKMYKFDTTTNTEVVLSLSLQSNYTFYRGTFVDGKIYYFGGSSFTPPQTLTYYNRIIIFDTKTNELKTLESLMVREAASVGQVYLNGKIYLFGGKNGNAYSSYYLNNIQIFDIATQTIKQAGTCYLAGNISAIAKDNIYLFGGSGSGSITNIGKLSLSYNYSYSELATKADVANLKNIVNTNEDLIQDAFTEIDTLKLTTIPEKQDKVDNNLATSNKNIVGAINEVNAKASGGGGTKLYHHSLFFSVNNRKTEFYLYFLSTMDTKILKLDTVLDMASGGSFYFIGGEMGTTVNSHIYSFSHSSLKGTSIIFYTDHTGLHQTDAISNSTNANYDTVRQL